MNKNNIDPIYSSIYIALKKVVIVIPAAANSTLCPTAFQLLLFYPPHAFPASLNLPYGPLVHLVMSSGLWLLPSPQAEEARGPQADVNYTQLSSSSVPVVLQAESLPSRMLQFVSTALATFSFWHIMPPPPCPAASPHHAGPLGSWHFARKGVCHAFRNSISHSLWNLTFCLP